MSPAPNPGAGASRAGSVLRRARLAAGLSQSQLAGAVGISHSYLARIDRGEGRLTPRVAELVAPLLGLPPTELLTAFVEARDPKAAEQRRHRAREKRAAAAVKAIEEALDVAAEPDGTPEELADLEQLRPRTRADCIDNGLRPCPFVSCRYNLRLDYRPGSGGTQPQSRLPIRPGDEAESCALDIADMGEQAQPRLASLLGCSPRTIGEVEESALVKFKARVAAASPSLAEDQAALPPANPSRSGRWRREARDEWPGLDPRHWRRLARNEKRAAQGKASDLPPGPPLDPDATITCEHFTSSVPVKVCVQRQRAHWAGRGSAAPIYTYCGSGECAQGRGYATRTSYRAEDDWAARSKRHSRAWQPYRPDLAEQRNRRRQWIRERPDHEVPMIDAPPGGAERPPPLDLSDPETRDALDQLAMGAWWSEEAETCLASAL